MRIVVVVVATAWLLCMVPFIVAGPDDLEELVTGVVGTDLAVSALAQGAAPLWTSTMALGLPQPLRFHFASHPLAAGCAAFDCQRVLRIIAALHVLAGALVTGLIVFQLTANAAVATAAGLTFLGCSSSIQPTYVDDWPLTAINETSLPLFVYSARALLHASPRSALLWSLALGGLAGLLLSMSFPVLVLVLTVVVILSEPRRLYRQLRWFLLAGTVTLAIGAGQLFHLAEQVRATPPDVVRVDHEEPRLALTFWSTFLRPLVPAQETSWRTAFFGPLFAISGSLSALAGRDRRLRPFRIAFIASMLGLVTPEQILLNLVTTQWAYRAGINFFGIVLGAWGIDRLWRKGRAWRTAAMVLTAVHLVSIAVAVQPAWMPVARAASSPTPMGQRRLAYPSHVAHAIRAIHQQKPGRWMFGERSYALLRELQLARHGLAPNQLPMLGVPTLNVVASGLTLDALYPVDAMLTSNTPPSAAAVQSEAFLNVLGIRYVVATDDDRIPAVLPRVATLAGGLSVYRNDAAWPEAFFVTRLRNDPVPRLAGCPHTRFLCADFSQYDLHRIEHEPVILQRHADGATLRFAPADRERYLLLTNWFQAGWQVTSGHARLMQAAEQLIGVAVDPGETEVRLRYFPLVRGALFLAGALTEIVVMLTLTILVIFEARRRYSRPSRVADPDHGLR
jgi:hypothetical protein